MRRVLLFPLTVVFLFLSVSYGAAFWEVLKHAGETPEVFLPLGIGAVVYGLLLFFLRLFRRNLEFAHTFCHELNHAVFNVLFLNRIRSFTARAGQGGDVSFYGKVNPLICLAPYSVPLFAVFALLFRTFAVSAALPVIEGAVGFFILFHLHSVFSQARLYQTDLQCYGVLFSYAMILLLNMVLVPWTLISASLGFHAGGDYLGNGLLEGWNLLKTIGGKL